MKRLLFLGILCLMALTVNAQKCAVLDFQIGTGVTEEEIDGLTYNFRSNFRVAGYTMLERIRINRTIEVLGFSRTDMTMQQVLKVGRELEAKLVVVGTMNKFMDEYSVDLRAIDVSTGVTCAAEGATFDKSNYRTRMESLASRLGEKLAGAVGSAQGRYGQNSDEQSNSSVNGSSSSVPRGYVDLGLPSGTYWKAINEGMYDWDTAMNKFGDKMPSQGQWEELKEYCTWTWTGSGYKVTGSNGKSIVLPAAGWCKNDGSMRRVGDSGSYWSSSPIGPKEAWYLHFNSAKIFINSCKRCDGLSVRLVQD